MEDRNMEHKPGGGKKGLAIAGIIAVAAVAVYLGLCVWVRGQGTVLPNVSVAGLSLSGMTAEQAERAVGERFAPQGNGMDKAVELRHGDYVGYLGGEHFQVDAAACVRAAMAVGRGNFFTAGARYVGHLMGGSENLPIDQVALNARGQAELDRQLELVDGELGTAEDENEYTADTAGGTLTMTKGRTHWAVDQQDTAAAVHEAFSKALNGEQGLVQLKTVEQPPKEPDFDGIHSQLYAQVQDAHLDPETYQITEGVLGVDFDRSAARAAFASAQEGGTFTVPLQLTHPKETKQSLEAKLFRDLLGQGTSVVGGTANRKTNVNLSAAACNGVILLPGQEFSYNGTTGSRTTGKGYLPAPIYVGGKSEDDIGGGICQTSSTIYYAVLHTALEVVERHDHKFAVGYVPDGMDATVFFGSLDFRFKNNTEYPVKIVAETYDKGGKRYLTVKLYGTNPEGRYGVPERTQFDYVQPTIKYVADGTVPRGTLVLDEKQNAYIGRKAHTYRYIYEKDGALVEKQDMGGSKYDMRPKSYHYNPLDGDPATWPNGVPPKQEIPPAAGGETTPPDSGTPGTQPGTEPGTEPGESAGSTSAGPQEPTDPVWGGGEESDREEGWSQDAGW